MPGHRTRAAARLGGVTSRRHAELLLHCGVGGVSVKDLRLRRVVPPAAGSVGSSPECTPPEAASAAAAAEDLDRKPVSQRSFLDLSVPVAGAYLHCRSGISASDCLGSPRGQVLPRSKLVRDPGSFGYRRLLPFLNEMAKNGNALFDSDSPRICLLRMVRFPIICSYMPSPCFRTYGLAWFR